MFGRQEMMSSAGNQWASVFEGTTFASMHRLLEAIHADQSQLLAANRLNWVSHLRAGCEGRQGAHSAGLKFKQFRLPGGKLASLDKATLEHEGSADQFDLKQVTPTDNTNFAVVWEGQVEITALGNWKFPWVLTMERNS